MLVISCGFDLPVLGLGEPWMFTGPVFMVDAGNDDYHGEEIIAEEAPKVEKKVPFKLTLVKD